MAASRKERAAPFIKQAKFSRSGFIVNVNSASATRQPALALRDRSEAGKDGPRVLSRWRAQQTPSWGMSRRSGIRFADKDMRQHENLRRVPYILDHSVIQYVREALLVADSVSA
jgi:hypothetical protein